MENDSVNFEYKLIDAENSHFRIDFKSGEVFLEKILNYNLVLTFYFYFQKFIFKNPFHILTIEISQNDQRWRKVLLIDVIDSNNNSPIFLRFFKLKH